MYNAWKYLRLFLYLHNQQFRNAPIGFATFACRPPTCLPVCLPANLPANLTAWSSTCNKLESHRLFKTNFDVCKFCYNSSTLLKLDNNIGQFAWRLNYLSAFISSVRQVIERNETQFLPPKKYSLNSTVFERNKSERRSHIYHAVLANSNLFNAVYLTI